MIRLALPKGRSLGVVRQALAAAGVALNGFDPASRLLRQTFAAEGVEVLLLKDWDLPLYVQRGIADCGVVGSDVLDEVDGDLLVPVRLEHGHCRLSLVGPPGAAPQPGSQHRLASKYPRIAASYLSGCAWGAEILPLTGSVELAPLLGLADLALDIVQTGDTLRANGLVELEVVRPVTPVLVVNRGAFHQRRADFNRLIDRLLAAEVAR